MPLLSFDNQFPQVAQDAFIAPGAMLIGPVTVGPGASVWFNAVLRADNAPIVVGRGSNVQDCCVLHAEEGQMALVGDDVTVGHGAVVHAATVEDRVLVGMKAVILDGAVVGHDSIVGAGAVVTPGSRIPPRSLVVGVPAKVVRVLTEEEVASIREQSRHYAQRAQRYRQELGSR